MRPLDVLFVVALAYVFYRVQRQENHMENLEQKIETIETVTTTLGNAVANVVTQLKNQTGAPTDEQLARLDRIADALKGDVAALTPTDANDVTTNPPTDTEVPTTGDGSADETTG